uniref:Uncharacterized protein n=1 Tax=Tanacetum cinerariifolium TaxID=118510 RepID=A0A699HZG4_TANCI|nr:hypothetical protein [Tanacetum cinerariifolium]
MTSITAQQTKLDLELVRKKNRLDIRKCNGKIPRRLKPKEETFQVVLDALALTPCYSAFVITADVPEVYIYKKEASQKYGDVLPECLISPQIKESKAYKTYLGYATGIVPPKVTRKFKKASPSKKDSVSVPADEEPVQKCKRVKRTAKKSSTTPTTGIVIREPPVETQSKRKEKVDVARGKGIDMLSEVALTEEAQMKEVRKKRLRDFHKSYPSSSGSVAEKPPSVEKITPLVTSEGTGDKLRVPNVTKDESTENGSESDSKSDQQDDDEDEDDNNDDDKFEGDEDRGMDNVQDEKADVGMTDA